jgi:Protein of unknown function (DUF3775)
MRATITMPIETLALIIAKARAMPDDEDASVDSGDDEEALDEDEEAAMLAADEGEPEDEDLDDDELTELLASLSDQDLVELLALMWVGRGEFDLDSWDGAVSKARDIGDEDALTHLLSTDDLGDLLEDGLTQLGYAVVVEQDGAQR